MGSHHISHTPSRALLWSMRLAWMAWAVCALLSPAWAAKGAVGILGTEERAWLDSHAASVRIAPEGNYPPFSFMESGEWHGLSADMIRLLQDHLSTHFKILPAQSLDTILSQVHQGDVDIVTSLKETPERSQFMFFTEPYVSVPTAIIVKAGFSAERWPASFEGRRVAVGKGYGVQKYLETRFPGIPLTLVADDLEGMRKLSFGEVDAVIMDVASASFFIEREKFTNLRMFDAFEYHYDLSFGVRRDLPVLRDVLSKALASISPRDRQALLDKWIRMDRDPLDVLLLWMARWRSWLVALATTLLIGGGMVWRPQRQRRKLEQKLARYARSLIEASLDPLVTISALGKITDVNTATENVTGIPRSELIGSDFAHNFTDPERARQAYRQVFAQGFVTDYPLAIRHASGKVTDVLYNASVYRDELGQVLGIFAAARDVTERKKAERSIQAASVFTYAREGIMITTADGTVLNVNDAFTLITGYSREDVLGKNASLLGAGQEGQDTYTRMLAELGTNSHWNGEVWSWRKSGERYFEALTLTAVRDADGRIEHYVTLRSDITTIKEHQNQLEQLAHFDALTGLPNRLLLSDRLRQALVQAERRNKALAVVYLDLDGFKAINDQYGHDAGDRLLIAVAGHMQQTLREGDTLARLGGDEFVAVLGDLPDGEACLPLLGRLLTAASQPVTGGEQLLQVSASIGVSFYPQAHGVDADQLLRQADQAMYQAKLAGKGRFHIFDAQRDSSLRVHNESLERIRLALREHEFVMHYQPKVNMQTGKLVGAEALIRWEHPQRGLLPPAQFLPVIEDHALAIAVGEWVLDTALTQLERWRSVGLHIAVSVNIGARQLQQADFVQRLRAILALHPQVHPSCLELEILETTALEDVTQISQLIASCAELGVRFALDDFGTGYSSLTYLKRLRVSTLKIDQSFVRDMLEDPDDLAILQGIIGLAQAFGRELIAEGVETAEHGRMLLQLGCHVAQGYGIARAMPGSDLPTWALTWQPEPSWSAQGADMALL